MRTDGTNAGAAANVIGLYRRHADAFIAARADGAHFPDRGWIARFLSHVPAAGEVLDIGCGPGRPVGTLIHAGGHPLTGVDSSPQLLAAFRQTLPDATAHLADMRTLALGRQFAGVLAWDSFFHLCADDQLGMFPIFAAHAAPGAPLLFNSGPAEGEAIGEFGGEPLYHASLDPDTCRRHLHDAGFDLLDHALEDPGCGGRTVWLFRRRAEPA